MIIAQLTIQENTQLFRGPQHVFEGLPVAYYSRHGQEHTDPGCSEIFDVLQVECTRIEDVGDAENNRTFRAASYVLVKNVHIPVP